MKRKQIELLVIGKIKREQIVAQQTKLFITKKKTTTYNVSSSLFDSYINYDEVTLPSKLSLLLPLHWQQHQQHHIRHAISFRHALQCRI